MAARVAATPVALHLLLPPFAAPPPHPPRPSYSLLWFFCLSWMHKVLAAGFVCLHLKAQGHISPTTEMQAYRTCIDTCIVTPPLPSRSRCSSTISFPSRSPPPLSTTPVTTFALTSHQVGEAVDQIKKQAKKHARRMPLAVRRKSEPPKPKDE